MEERGCLPVEHVDEALYGAVGDGVEGCLGHVRFDGKLSDGQEGGRREGSRGAGKGKIAIK